MCPGTIPHTNPTSSTLLYHVGRPVRAPLANPYATPPPPTSSLPGGRGGDSGGVSVSVSDGASGVSPAVDWALRTIALALLRRDNEPSSPSSSPLSLPVLSDGEKQLLLDERFPRTEVTPPPVYLIIYTP